MRTARAIARIAMESRLPVARGYIKTMPTKSLAIPLSSWHTPLQLLDPVWTKMVADVVRGNAFGVIILRIAIGLTPEEQRRAMSRLSRTLGILVTILILPAAAAAQFPPAPPPLARGTAVIVGQVVDAATGKGVSSAIVSLGGTRRAMSTSDGRFAFRALPSGSHSLSAVRSGYIGGAYGMRRPDGPTLPVVLADGERRADIVILMWRNSSITGSIVDEAGEPVVGIQVTALRRTTVGGRRRFAQTGVGTTDDRGVYRLSRLAPGDYAVGMIASQVSVPAATVRQFEETAMSGGDLNRNAVFQAMMQVGATPLMSGTESRQVGDHVQTIGRGAPYLRRSTARNSSRIPASTILRPRRRLRQRSSRSHRARSEPASTFRCGPCRWSKYRAPSSGELRRQRRFPCDSFPRDTTSGRTADVGATVTDASGGFSFLAVPAGDYVIKIVQVPRPATPTAAQTTFAVGTSMMTMGSFTPNPDVPPIPTEPTLWAIAPDCGR